MYSRHLWFSPCSGNLSAFLFLLHWFLSHFPFVPQWCNSNGSSAQGGRVNGEPLRNPSEIPFRRRRRSHSHCSTLVPSRNYRVRVTITVLVRCERNSILIFLLLILIVAILGDKFKWLSTCRTETHPLFSVQFSVDVLLMISWWPLSVVY